MPALLRAKAYAKVNLFLEITGKRADGYHILSTLFQTISLADEFTFRTSETLRLTCSDATLPTDERNLAFRAAKLLKDRLHETHGVHMQLRKQVPMGAGLGGGSGDAGTVLRVLTKWWQRNPSASVLHKIALKCGADVPFFLKGGTCAAFGIGDVLRPLPPLPKTWMVLVYPGFGVPTKEAYSRVRVPHLGSKKSIYKMTALLQKGPAAWADRLFNRFEEFIFPAFPKLPQLKQELLDAGAIGALMSGSGSTMVGIVENAAAGRKLLQRMRKSYPQSWLVHTV